MGTRYENLPVQLLWVTLCWHKRRNFCCRPKLIRWNYTIKVMRCKARRWRVFKYLAYLFCDRYLWSMQWVAGCHGGRATRETIWLEIITYRTNAASSRPNSVNKYFIIWPSLFSPFSSFFLSARRARACAEKLVSRNDHANYLSPGICDYGARLKWPRNISRQKLDYLFGRENVLPA